LLRYAHGIGVVSSLKPAKMKACLKRSIFAHPPAEAARVVQCVVVLPEHLCRRHGQGWAINSLWRLLDQDADVFVRRGFTDIEERVKQQSYSASL